MSEKVDYIDPEELTKLWIELIKLREKLKRKLKEYPEESGIKTKTISYRETGDGIIVCDTELFKYLVKKHKQGFTKSINYGVRGGDGVDIYGNQFIIVGDDLDFWIKVCPDLNMEKRECEKIDLDDD